MASRKTPGSGGSRRRTTGKLPPAAPSELILYTTPDRQTRIEVRLEDETVWLSQVQMAELFQTTKQNVSLHIRNVFEEGELTRDATVKESLTVQREGETMAAWATKLDAFLTLNDRDTLGDAGRISQKMAVGVAGREFEKHDREQRRIAAASVTDFDKAVDHIKKLDS